MKIEFIEEETPSVWQMATSGRLEASALVIRNLRKLSLDESSSAGKAAKSALNVYNHIEVWKDCVLKCPGLLILLISDVRTN